MVFKTYKYFKLARSFPAVYNPFFLHAFRNKKKKPQNQDEHPELKSMILFYQKISTSAC
jgi:hypothetical protein